MTPKLKWFKREGKIAGRAVMDAKVEGAIGLRIWRLGDLEAWTAVYPPKATGVDYRSTWQLAAMDAERKALGAARAVIEALT